MSLLVGQSALGDTSRFNEDSKISSGKQLVDIYINKVWRGQYIIDVNHDGQHINLASEDISKLGLNLSSAVTDQAKQQQWIPIDSLVKNI